MPETRILGLWSWFVRAFAAGFGAMCGVMTAGLLGCLAYVLLLGGIWAFSSAQSTTVPTLVAPVATVPPGPYTAQLPPPQMGTPYAGDGPYYSASPAFHAEVPPPADEPNEAVPAAFETPTNSVDEDASADPIPVAQ